jgi:hypothetical protein
MCQAPPVHCSTNAPAFDQPTATHTPADGQATAYRSAPPAAGFGVGWILHERPFHRSASVPEFDKPTAVHADPEEQSTPK